MLLKTLVVVLLCTILLSLGASFVFLLKDGNQSRRTVNTLFIRVSLSILLLIIITLGFYTGSFHGQG